MWLRLQRSEQRYHSLPHPPAIRAVCVRLRCVFWGNKYSPAVYSVCSICNSALVPLSVSTLSPIKAKKDNNNNKKIKFTKIAWYLSHKTFSVFQIFQWHKRVTVRTNGCRWDSGHAQSDLQWPRPLSTLGTGWTWTCFHIHPVGALWGWQSQLPVNTTQRCTWSLRASLHK